MTWPRHWNTKGRFTLSDPSSMFEMSDSTCPIDAMETKEEHENSLDGAAVIVGNQLVEGAVVGQLVEGEVDGEDVGLIDGNQLVEGEIVGNNEMEGEDDVDGEDEGLGVGQSQQPHWTSPQSTVTDVATSQTAFGTEPVNELETRYSAWTFVIRPISEGREPVNELNQRTSNSTFVIRPISVGREPVNELKERFRYWTFVIRPISEGREPVNELPIRFSIWTFVIRPISMGREPVYELLSRSRYSKSSIIVRDDRISPEMEFLERSSLFKFVSRARSWGVESVIPLRDKFRSVKLVSSLICVGKNPI